LTQYYRRSYAECWQQKFTAILERASTGEDEGELPQNQHSPLMAAAPRTAAKLGDNKMPAAALRHQVLHAV
ncbi:unnamed protein product, partial [Amoebophrya sp. A120]